MCIDFTEVSPGLALKGMLLETEIKRQTHKWVRFCQWLMTSDRFLKSFGRQIPFERATRNILHSYTIEEDFLTLRAIS